MLEIRGFFVHWKEILFEITVFKITGLFVYLTV